MLCYIQKHNFFIYLFVFFINFLSFLFLPLFLLYLWIRSKKGKEEFNRLGERFGFTKEKFTIKSKPTIWLHAASVGESVALLNLTQRMLDNKNYNILFTTGTVTSAKLIKATFYEAIDKGFLIHQYNIFDFGWCLNKFIKYWNVKLAINCESELWPNKIFILSLKKIPQIVVNATMSENSFKSWRKFSKLTNILFSKINLILTQNQNSLQKYRSLGAKQIIVTGNLKSEAKPYIKEENLLAKLQEITKDRIFISAISTHNGEDELILEIYNNLKKIYNNLGLILIPRHIERSKAIIEHINSYKFTYIRKTGLVNEPELAEKIEIIIGDTIGEIGFFLSLTNIAFIGKSLAKIGGGHNPIEPILMNVPVISGNKINNFLQIYEKLQKTEACIIVDNEIGLFDAIKLLLDNSDVKEKIIKNAHNTIKNMQGTVELSYNLLQPYLENILQC